MNAYLILSLGLISGFLLGIAGLYLLLKHRVDVVRERGEFLTLELPVLGRIRTRFRTRYSGLFIQDWRALRDRLKKLEELLDSEFIYRYAGKYEINYVGFEGDREDKSWSPEKLAYSALSGGYTNGYNIFLNPRLDRNEIALRLSRELGETIYPDEVHRFLFLHEIGHTRRSGNQCYFTAVINYSLSGGKRYELGRLKRDIERYADRFALRELKLWRTQTGQDRMYPSHHPQRGIFR